MLITIRVPKNTIKIMYIESDESGYESEPRNVTMDRFVKVEREKGAEES